MSDIPIYILGTIVTTIFVMGLISFVAPQSAINTFGLPCTTRETESLVYIFGNRALGFGGSRRSRFWLKHPANDRRSLLFRLVDL